MASSATGLEQILADLKRIMDTVSGPGLSSIMQEAGTAGVQEAQSRARVDTGAMRDATTWTQEGNTAGKLGSSVDYAAANELGTSKMSAQPFITPGALVVVEKIKEGLNSAISSGSKGAV
jgi:HK97 gp10 family phage protein